MKARPVNTQYSLHKIKRWLLIAIVLIAVNIGITTYSILIIRQQNIDYITNSVLLYQEDVSSKLRSIEHFIQWSIVNEPLIETMETTRDYQEQIKAISAFRTRVSDTQYATGKDFQYFLSLQNPDMFFNGSALKLSYADYCSLKSHFQPLIAKNALISSNYSWQTMSLNEQSYFYYCLQYHNRTFFTIISAQDLLLSLPEMNLGANGQIMIADKDNHPLTGNLTEEELNQHSFLLNHISFTPEETGLPFTLHVYLDNFGNFEKMMLIQVAVILCIVLLCIILTVFTLYLHQKVIEPIKLFSSNLAAIDNDSPLFQLPDTRILELSQANEQFKNLIHEVQRLKINIYEQELDKKRIQIAFLQQQIRPHFYLNCLTTIYSMAQIQEYKLIEEMTLMTSQYLRYLFQSDRDFVLLEQEVTHVNHYIQIQTLRYGHRFSYQCLIDEELYPLAVPPLLLITFIENALKYGVSDNQELAVTLSASVTGQENHRRLHIIIEDNGPGFDPKMLTKLNSQELLTTDMGTRIGIANATQRLALLYKDDYSIRFFNTTPHGARIEIELRVIETGNQE